MEGFSKMKKLLILLAIVAASLPLSAAVCPTTPNTNTDCGYILTIGPGGVISGAPVAGANPYDGADDALIGIVNKSGATFTGSISLSGSGNGGGLFAFDGDGICSYVPAAYCATAATGYEGPLVTFSNITAGGLSGKVNVNGLADGASTYFALEGSPASINPCLTTTQDLAPPGLSSYIGVDVGNAQIGTSFVANSDFSITSAGIKFNPFGNVTGQPKTAELDVFIYSVVGTTRGALLASASYCAGGACPQPTLLPSTGYPTGAATFFDVPIAYNFKAGQKYLVEFNVKPNGWGSGLLAKNFVEFYRYDPAYRNAPPFQGSLPFTVGPLTVLDGAFNGDFANQCFPHVRLIQECP
jgi:hypothetical protein